MLSKILMWYDIHKAKIYLKKKGFSDKEIKFKIAIANIRKEFLLFGHDLSEYTDDDIVQGFVIMKQLIQKSGVTIKVASNALRLMANNTA